MNNLMMEDSFLKTVDSSIIISLLGIFMLISSYLGFLWGGRNSVTNPNQTREGNSAIISAIFAITGFLLAFTFSMVGTRYEMRRENIVKEAVAIGTAYLRSDLYPETERSAFKKDFKKYIDARINYFEKNTNSIDENKCILEAQHYGQLIWKRASRIAEDPKYFVASNQMIPAINQMLDISVIRYMSEKAKLPDFILYMLFILLIVSSFFAGYIKFGKEKIDKTLTVGFCLVTILVISTILDLDRPRRGLIKLNVFHKSMLDVRKQMEE